MDLQTQLLKIKGLDLSVSSLGEGPAVLLLHGFPDSHLVWRHQITALAAAGYRVIAPDLRGYGASSAPVGVANYRMEHLCADCMGILDALGIDRAHVVGHDWGAVIAWQLAIQAPQRLYSLVALSVGHPAAFLRAGLPQALRSSYIALFLMRGVAEAVLPAFDWLFLRRATTDPELFQQWRRDLSRTGRLTAALNLYRANARPGALAQGRVHVPVLGLWSTGDRFLNERQMALSADDIDGEFSYQRIDGADHWLQLGSPDVVNTALLKFFAAYKAAA